MKCVGLVSITGLRAADSQFDGGERAAEAHECHDKWQRGCATKTKSGSGSTIESRRQRPATPKLPPDGVRTKP